MLGFFWLSRSLTHENQWRNNSYKNNKYHAMYLIELSCSRPRFIRLYLQTNTYLLRTITVYTQWFIFRCILLHSQWLHSRYSARTKSERISETRYKTLAKTTWKKYSRLLSAWKELAGEENFVMSLSLAIIPCGYRDFRAASLLLSSASN